MKDNTSGVRIIVGMTLKNKIADVKRLGDMIVVVKVVLGKKIMNTVNA